jgi:long-chain acyl-CoA synthetase
MFPSLAAMHRSSSERLGRRVALRFKRDGLYRDLSWTDYRRQADWAAAGLIGLGVEPGDRIALLSENRYEWLVADHAILSAAAVNVPLHAPLAPKQVQYQVSHSDSRGLILSGQQQADKVWQVIDELPDLEFVICFDSIEPTAAPRELNTLTWEGLKHRGRQRAAGRVPGWGDSAAEEVRTREAKLTRDHLATIIYTSGTTGTPKGVMLTHGNLVSNAESTLQVAKVDSDDVVLSWLPYSHIYARTVDHYLSTLAGLTLCLAESVDTLIINLAEICPTWMNAVPRFYEKVWSSVEHLPAEARRAELHAIFRSRIRQLSSGGAPLPRHVCEGIFEAGIPLLEGYGLTETSPVITFSRFDNFRIGTVGQAIPGVEIRIAEDGEILTRGPHVMPGYWKNPQATEETIVKGWLHTGDVGELDEDGFLSITDRKKDLIITSSGKNIAPGELERLLAGDVYIDQAVVYGDGRQFISALIVPNFENLKSKVQELGCTLDVQDELIQTPALLDFYQQRIDSMMEAVSRPERVKKFRLLARPLQLEADELTATLKVRRRHVIQKYEAQLAMLYES